jgi:hypothetical protein
MKALAPAELARLAKLLGMLGSCHDGERANAGAAADRFLRDRGVTWPMVLGLEEAPGRKRQEEQKRHRDDAGEMLDFCLDADQRLFNDWERTFLASISERHKRLSEKQLAILCKLYARAKRAAT